MQLSALFEVAIISWDQKCFNQMAKYDFEKALGTGYFGSQFEKLQNLSL